MPVICIRQVLLTSCAALQSATFTVLFCCLVVVLQSYIQIFVHILSSLAFVFFGACYHVKKRFYVALPTMLCITYYVVFLNSTQPTFMVILNQELSSKSWIISKLSFFFHHCSGRWQNLVPSSRLQQWGYMQTLLIYIINVAIPN